MSGFVATDISWYSYILTGSQHYAVQVTVRPMSVSLDLGPVKKEEEEEEQVTISGSFNPIQ